MRGWGAPSHETATESLTRPDWGWGDDAPTSWDVSTLDYGWGSDHGAAFPSYLELETRAIGDRLCLPSLTKHCKRERESWK